MVIIVADGGQEWYYRTGVIVAVGWKSERKRSTII